MKVLAILLLSAVVLCHASGRGLAALSGYNLAGMEHILRGLLFVALSCVILALLWHVKRDGWRDLSFAALGISISEGAQMAGCRLALGPVNTVPRGVNMCDVVLWPTFSAFTLTLYGIALAALAGHWFWKSRGV